MLFLWRCLTSRSAPQTVQTQCQLFTSEKD